MDKKSARRAGLSARAAICDADREYRSRLIQEKVIGKIRCCNVIGCYASINDEVDTSLIRRWCYENNKVLAVPRVTGNTLVFHRIRDDRDLKEGCFRVPEPVCDDPVAPEDIDFMIVPLSAFDDNRSRTGYGKGYYDSILSRCRYNAGLAFREQKTDIIETDPWDVTLDEIIYM